MRKIMVFLVFIFSSCSVLNSKRVTYDIAKKVKIVSLGQKNLLDKCTEKKPITEGSEFGQAQLIIDVKYATAENDGNVFLSSMIMSRGFGVLNASDKVTGVVYDCPQETLSNLKDFGE